MEQDKQGKAAEAVGKAVEDWHADTFFNLGLSTELSNRIHNAKEGLKSRILEAITSVTKES